MADKKRIMNCGCVVALDYDKTLTIRYCSKHKASEGVYEALKTMREQIANQINPQVKILSMVKQIELIDEALAKADESKRSVK